MRLITEQIDNILAEAVVSANDTKYFLQGVFLQSNLQNRNGRIYPDHILEAEIGRYNQAYVSTRRALGELGHPSEPTINLDRASHLIIELYKDGNNYIGKAEVLDTPLGKIAKTFIDAKVKLGVSSRGMGTLKENNKGVQEVQDDFFLATVDIVADPSAPGAFVQGIMEGKEWVFLDGVLTEKRIERVKKAVSKAPSKRLEETILKEWQRIIDAL